MKLSLITTAVSLSFVLALTVGCSKPSPEEQKKREDDLAKALASALAVPSSTPAATSAGTKTAAPSGGIQATCNNKQDGKCTESSGAEGFGAEDSCKRLGGVYTKGATPCSKDSLLGTCTRADATSGLNDVDYYYKQAGVTADSMKSLCETVMSGTWTGAAPSAKPQASGVAKKAAGKTK